MKEPTELYLIFHGNEDSTVGGWADFFEHFPDMETLFDWYDPSSYGVDWAQVVSLEERKIIFEWSKFDKEPKWRKI